MDKYINLFSIYKIFKYNSEIINKVITEDNLNIANLMQIFSLLWNLPYLNVGQKNQELFPLMPKTKGSPITPTCVSHYLILLLKQVYKWRSLLFEFNIDFNQWLNFNIS